MSLSGTLLELLNLQNTITNTIITILNFILSVVAPGVDVGGRREIVSTDISNLHATADKLVKTVMARNTVNIKAIIAELENRRLALMNHDPRSVTRADITNLSQTAKILVSAMRILPDKYDEALTRAVSAKLHLG